MGRRIVSPHVISMVCLLPTLAQTGWERVGDVRSLDGHGVEFGRPMRRCREHPRQRRRAALSPFLEQDDQRRQGQAAELVAASLQTRRLLAFAGPKTARVSWHRVLLVA